MSSKRGRATAAEPESAPPANAKRQPRGPSDAKSEPAALCAHHTVPLQVAAYASAFKDGTPFPHVQVMRMFPEPLLRRVRDELNAADYDARRNDLYDFEQTRDLRGVSSATALVDHC